MEITHTKNSVILKPSNSSQMFLLGRLFQKFPNLGWRILYEESHTVGLELKDASLDKLLIDCVDKFNTT